EARTASPKLVSEPPVLLGAGDDEGKADGPSSIEGDQLVLAHLDRADREDVRAVRYGTARLVRDRTKRRIDAVRDDGDAPRRNVVQVHEVSLGALGDGDHPCGASNGARNGEAEGHPILPAHQLGVTCERDVVHRDDARARRTQRERVLRVTELDSEAPQRPWERPGHPELLRAGRQLVWLDIVRDQLRMTRDRDEPNVGGRCARADLAEQVQGVGLVPGPLAAEDVGIEGDRLHTSLRQRSRVAPAVRVHVKADARSRPAFTSSSRRALASAIAPASAETSSGSTSTAAPFRTSTI